MSVLRLLHLAGSAESDFHCNLSRLYANHCLAATAPFKGYAMTIAYVTPDRQWRFPASLSRADIAAADPMPLAEALDWITAQKIDVVLPQMYCLTGMTQYRALLDVLEIPYMGNSADLMALTAHKAKAKAIVAAAGIQVPDGELLHPGQRPTIQPPVVIKPVTADNSLGIVLVKDARDYDAALTTAFAYSNQVLVEEYIEIGREVRCGIIVRDGELLSLPLEEYPVDPQNHPIRNYADKFKQTEEGDLVLVAKGNGKAWIVDTSDPATATVQAVAKQCHQALGCRHYSLFDFRIDPQGTPWFLEAGLYCSFSPKSVIATMARAVGISLDELLSMTLHETLGSQVHSHERPT